MEKQQLEYFLLVADTCNVSKAAEQLWISQPALSQAIKRLEKELGYPLFTRSGKRIFLNENGKIFYNYAHQIKLCYDSALSEIKENNDIMNRELNFFIGCASLYLPQLLIYLKKYTNNIVFHIFQMNSYSETTENMDLRIIASPQPLKDKHMSLLLEETIMLALPKDHDLTRKETIDLIDLKGIEFIGLNSSWMLEKIINEKCAQYNFEPYITIRVDNPAVLRNLLCKNLGIAFIPEKTWGISFSNGELVLRKIPALPIKRYIYLAWNEGYQKKIVRTCIPLIKNFFELTFS